MKKYTDKEIEKIVNENKKLKLENSSMKKMLNSKRFLAADRIANTFNALLPEGTRRRGAVNRIEKSIKAVTNRKVKRIIKNINRIKKDKKKVIVIQSIVWDAPLKQRPHHLARCLAGDNNVLVVYFEPAEQLHAFRKITSNLVTTNSWEAIEKICGDEREYYFFFNNVYDISFKKIEEIKEIGYEIVYEYIDEFHEDVAGSLVNQLDVWDKLPNLKPALVLASATKLFNEAKKHFKNNCVRLSRNAVNVEDFDFHLFEDKRTPEDLAKVLEDGKPIVGYYGALAHWLDYNLISNFAKKNKDLNVVLIGVNYQHALEKLDQRIKNIHYLGPKKYDELPLYSAKFDCAIIPFQTGQIAKGTSPVKLFEYMAMGLPTVGTKDLDECRGYDYVYLADGVVDFGNKIKRGIVEHANPEAKERLLAQARENSWQARADDILRWLA